MFINSIKNLFKKTKIIYVDNISSFRDFLGELSKQKIIGIDTEFDWRRTYFPKISLIQFGFNKRVYLIDCIALKNLQPLKIILEEKDKMIIFHSSRSDTTVLSSNLNIFVKNVFDIQIAEKIINSGEVKNYAFIVEKYLKISLRKGETNSNWLKRPLSKSQIEYASNDAKFLIEIFKKQKKVLENLGKYSEALTFSKNEAEIGNEDFLKNRLKKQFKLSKNQKKVFIWRENIAKKFNLPPSFILKDNLISKVSNLDMNDKSARKKLTYYFGDSDIVDIFFNKFK